MDHGHNSSFVARIRNKLFAASRVAARLTEKKSNIGMENVYI